MKEHFGMEKEFQLPNNIAPGNPANAQHGSSFLWCLEKRSEYHPRLNGLKRLAELKECVMQLNKVPWTGGKDQWPAER